SPRLPETYQPVARKPDPKWAVGSWSHQERRSNVPADRARSPAHGSSLRPEMHRCPRATMRPPAPCRIGEAPVRPPNDLLPCGDLEPASLPALCAIEIIA